MTGTGTAQEDDDLPVLPGGERRALLLRTAGIIHRHPGRHTQQVWIDPHVWRRTLVSADLIRLWADMTLEPGVAPECRATGCTAGWIVILGCPDGTRFDADVCGVSRCLLPGGAAASVRVLASSLAGLDTWQALWLFSEDRTREQVIAALIWLADHPRAGENRLGRLPPARPAVLAILP